MTDASAVDINFAGKTFLIVDDFNGMRTMLRDILRNCGAEQKSIDGAANGAEAVNLLSKGKYDVVLCDYNLGPGKNGQQVLEEAHVRNLVGPACAWIMITAEKTTDVVMGAAEFQPDAYMLKPITEAALRTRIARIWARKEAFRDISRAMARHDYAKAITLCDKRLASDKANASDLLRLKCQLLLDSGDLEKTRQAYEEALSIRDLPWARCGLAKVLFQTGEVAAAREMLERLVAENKTFLEAYDWLAKCHNALGNGEAAADVLAQATRLSPNSVTRQKNLGEVTLKIGKLDEAEKAFRKSVNLSTNSVLKTPDAFLGLARTCSAKNDPAEALRVLGGLGKEFDAPEVRLRAMAVEGMVHQQSGNPAKAREVAQQLAAELENSEVRHDSKAALDMAQLLLATGEKERAVALLSNEVKNNAENASFLGEIKDIFAAADMAEEGAEVVESSRREAVELMNRGVLLMRDNKVDEAIDWMRNARQVMPSNVRVLFNLAYVLISRMQRTGVDSKLADEARACLLDANRLTPGEKRFAELMGLLHKIDQRSD